MLLPLALALHYTVAGARAHASSALLIRQSTSPISTSGTTCSSECNSVTDAVSDAGIDMSKLCAQSIVNGFASCYDCLIEAGGLTASTAQSTLDSYVDGCAANGYRLSSVTVSGGSSSGGGSGTTGSGFSPNGGSSSGTTARSAAAAGATSSGSGSGSGSSSSSSSSSSGDDLDSSSSNDTGGTSDGAGFHTGAASRLCVGTSVVGGVVGAGLYALLA